METKELKKEKGAEKNAYGLTETEVASIKDIIPTMDLGKLTDKTPPIELKVLMKEPKTLAITPKSGINKGKEVILDYLDCEDMATKMKVRIFLSAGSLKREFYKIAQSHKFNLENINVRISVRLYEHELYGADTRAFIVQAF